MLVRLYKRNGSLLRLATHLILESKDTIEFKISDFSRNAHLSKSHVWISMSRQHKYLYPATLIALSIPVEMLEYLQIV